VTGKSSHHDSRADELLALRCQLGERPAFDALITRWHEPMIRYLRSLSDAQSAADLAQETWIRVFRGITRLREPAKLRAWLFGIAHRVAIDRLRGKYAVPPMADVDVSQIEFDDTGMNLEEEIATLERGLANLPVIEREVLTLFYLQELSLEEMAEVLGIPLGTVKSRLFRARQLLRRELAQTGEFS
jgi:RNA polymerase sigma factor (sigma-70 family)